MSHVVFLTAGPFAPARTSASALPVSVEFLMNPRPHDAPHLLPVAVTPSRRHVGYPGGGHHVGGYSPAQMMGKEKITAPGDPAHRAGTLIAATL